MKSEMVENRKRRPLVGKPTLAETLTTGTNVTAPNEAPIRTSIVELEPFVRVKRPSRSSTFYDKIE